MYFIKEQSLWLWNSIIVKDIIQKYLSTQKWKWFKYVSYDILVWNNEVRIETLFWDVLWYVVTHKISCLCILFITTCAMVTPNAFPKLWSYKWRGLSESVHWILEQTMSKVWFKCYNVNIRAGDISAINSSVRLEIDEVDY